MSNKAEETMERWRELALSVLDQNKRLVEELQEWMKLTERLSQENKQLSAMLDERDPRGKLQ